MKSIIQELYYGNVLPQEATSGANRELKEKLRKLSETEEQIRNILSDEALVLFEDYANKCTEFSCISCADSYVIGFRHGSKFAYDAFIDE